MSVLSTKFTATIVSYDAGATKARGTPFVHLKLSTGHHCYLIEGVKSYTCFRSVFSAMWPHLTDWKTEAMLDRAINMQMPFMFDYHLLSREGEVSTVIEFMPRLDVGPR